MPSVLEVVVTAPVQATVVSSSSVTVSVVPLMLHLLRRKRNALSVLRSATVPVIAAQSRISSASAWISSRSKRPG